MKRLSPLLCLSLVLTLIVTPFAWAAATAPAQPVADKSPAGPLVAAVSTVTGIAISPLLGTAAYGAYQWFTARDEAAREALPWYAHWSFFGPALLIVAVCAAKDTFGVAVPPGLKKPLDVLELLENKASGLVALGAVVPFTMAGASKLLTGTHVAFGAAAPAGSGLALLPLGTIDWSPLLSVLTVPLGMAVFAVVWMASHAINVLILLSPWGAIDAALKAMRTALLGLIALTATLDPRVAALLSFAVIVVAYFVAGWAFRLTVFGTVSCWDFITGRRHRFTPGERENPMFSGGGLPGVPVRTYGWLVANAEGGFEFAYKPWLVLSERRVTVPARSLAVGHGLFFSSIITESGALLFLLPPRYRGHEQQLVDACHFTAVREAGLRKAWSALKELFGGAAAKPVPA